MGDVKLSDFPAEAAEMLLKLDRPAFDLLTAEVMGKKWRLEIASLPSDPTIAAPAAGKAMRRPAHVEIEEPLQHMMALLDVIGLVLGGGDDIDRQDAFALWQILEVGRRALRKYAADIDEAGKMLTAVTHPQT